MTDEYIPPEASLGMKRALRGIWDELHRMGRADGNDVNFLGQRLANISDGLSDSDAATVRQLKEATDANALAKKVRGEF